VSQDIREWAAGKGIELAAKGRIPNRVREEYEADQVNGHGPDAGDETPLLIVPDGPEPAADAPEAPAAPITPPEERRPQKPPRERRGLLARKPADGKARRTLPRVSLENLISSGWALGAMALARNPQAIPVARVMDMQSPVAGVIVDDMVRGTAIDRLLQPLARAGERGEKAVALLGPPVLTGLVVAHPEWFPAIRPMLKMSIMSWLEISEPAMKKAQARAERFSEKFGDVDVDGMINALFSDVDLPVQHSPDEDAAVRRAQNSDG